MIPIMIPEIPTTMPTPGMTGIGMRPIPRTIASTITIVESLTILECADSGP